MFKAKEDRNLMDLRRHSSSDSDSSNSPIVVERKQSSDLSDCVSPINVDNEERDQPIGTGSDDVDLVAISSLENLV